MRVAAALVVLVGCGASSSEPAAPQPASCAGSQLIGGQDALDAIGACPRFDGDLTIRSGAPLDLAALTGVAEVTGDLVIGPTIDVDVVVLDGLTRVGGTLRVVSNGAATGAFLPALEHAGGIEIAANVSLMGISAPQLREVEADLVVEDNAVLEVINATALTRVGGTLRIRGNAVLNLVDLASLASAGGIDVEGPALPEELREQIGRLLAQP